MTPLNRRHAQDWVRSGAVVRDLDLTAEHESPEALGEMALMVVRVFGTREGELVLQQLLQSTLFKSPVDVRLPEGEARRYAHVREGENRAVSLILAYLNHAEDLERMSHAPDRPDREPPPQPEFFDGSGGDGSGAEPG